MPRHRQRPPPQPIEPDDDAHLFRRAVTVDTRFHNHRIEPHARHPAPRPRAVRTALDTAPPAALSASAVPADRQTGETLWFCRPGVRAVDVRRLRRGQLTVTASIDLHGMTRIAAAQALAIFLHEARRDGDRCVRIIHGKGLRSPAQQAVLKHNVDLWLRQHHDVLAFCSARPADGGAGAVNVLLRR